MDLSKSDIDKIESEFQKFLSEMQLYLVTNYEELSRKEAKKLIWQQIKALMGN